MGTERYSWDAATIRSVATIGDFMVLVFHTTYCLEQYLEIY